MSCSLLGKTTGLQVTAGTSYIGRLPPARTVQQAVALHEQQLFTV